MADVLLELPRDLRQALKDPFGPIYATAEDLLADASRPVVAVGDVVTYHLLAADHTPTVAFVDERTRREDVDPEVLEGIIGFDREVSVDNPAGTLTAGLLAALCEGLDDDRTTLVRVDGEEDLATLASILAVPEGASVVYGQPGEGMVLVTADAATKEEGRAIVERMDGDVERALSLVDAEASD